MLLPAVSEVQYDNNERKTTQRISGCAGVDTYLLQQLGLLAGLRWTTRQRTRALVSSPWLVSAVWLCLVVAMQSQMLLQMQTGLVVRVYLVPVSLRNKHSIVVLAIRIVMLPGVGGSGAEPSLRDMLKSTPGMCPPVTTAGAADSSASCFPGAPEVFFGLLFGAIPSGMLETLSKFCCNFSDFTRRLSSYFPISDLVTVGLS